MTADTQKVNITEADLIAFGLSRADVAAHCPGAVPRIAISGELVWDRSDLQALFGEGVNS